jgi:hypothetical protein
MSRQLLFGALILALLPLGAQAECTPEQKARMIKEDVPDETIEKICGDTKAAGAESQDSRNTAGGSGADDDGESRHFVVGIHSMASGYSWETTYEDDLYYYSSEDSFTGSASGLYGRASFNDNFAIQASSYSGDVTDDYSDGTTSMSGVAAHLLLGGGLAHTGGNAYIGGGFFREKWDEVTVSTDTFSGLSLIAGLGYTWEYFHISTDITIRDTSDYDKFAKEALQDQGYYNINNDQTSVFTFHLRAGIPF